MLRSTTAVINIFYSKHVQSEYDSLRAQPIWKIPYIPRLFIMQFIKRMLVLTSAANGNFISLQYDIRDETPRGREDANDAD